MSLITQQDIERFRELMNFTHTFNGREFTTDELRIEAYQISIWDDDTRKWFYLTNDLDWSVDSEDNNILKLR